MDHSKLPNSCSAAAALASAAADVADAVAGVVVDEDVEHGDGSAADDVDTAVGGVFGDIVAVVASAVAVGIVFHFLQ